LPILALYSSFTGHRFRRSSYHMNCRIRINDTETTVRTYISRTHSNLGDHLYGAQIFSEAIILRTPLIGLGCHDNPPFGCESLLSAITNPNQAFPFGKSVCKGRTQAPILKFPQMSLKNRIDAINRLVHTHARTGDNG
jgi:hypothetical protein